MNPIYESFICCAIVLSHNSNKLLPFRRASYVYETVALKKSKLLFLKESRINVGVNYV